MATRPQVKNSSLLLLLLLSSCLRPMLLGLVWWVSMATGGNTDSWNQIRKGLLLQFNIM